MAEDGRRATTTTPTGWSSPTRDGTVVVFNAGRGADHRHSARPRSARTSRAPSRWRAWTAAPGGPAPRRTTASQRTGHPERNLSCPAARRCSSPRATSATSPAGRSAASWSRSAAPGTARREELSRAELVSTVAHELRSPLTSVKGFTATLLAKWDRFTDDQKRLMLETVNADADRVTRLITELLDIARIDSGRLSEPAGRRPGCVVGGTWRRWRPAVRSRPLPRAGRGRLPEMWVDPDKIDQVLGNLLENAVRHGAGMVTIVVEPDGDGDHRSRQSP